MITETRQVYLPMARIYVLGMVASMASLIHGSTTVLKIYWHSAA